MSEATMPSEFLVSESLPAPDGFIVRGICNRGSIAIDDSFERVVHDVPQRASEPVALRVVGIVAYRRSIDELPEGMSAELRCVGSAGGGLRPNDLLIGAEAQAPR
jgi:hypothetical protein